HSTRASPRRRTTLARSPLATPSSRCCAQSSTSCSVHGRRVNRNYYSSCVAKQEIRPRPNHFAGPDPRPKIRGRMTADPRKPLVLGSLLLAAFAINLDTTIVNVALPTLVRELHASTSQLEWIVDAYSLAFAALVLAAGNLGDRAGRKGVLLT